MTPVYRTPKALFFGFVALVLLTALDLGSKEWAVDTLSAARDIPPAGVCEPAANGERGPMERLPTRSVVFVANHFELAYRENCGAAFGIGTNVPRVVRTFVFGAAAVIASIALSWMFVIGRGTALFAWSVPLIVSGAIGNLVDRVRRGYVVDFIRVYASSWEYPTFNIADTTIVIGIGLLLIESFRADREAAKVKQESSTPKTSESTDEAS